MPNSRYPRRGHRLAPAMLRHLLEVPIPAKYASGGKRGLLLADLDETAWERFSAAACLDLSRLVVRAIAGKVRTPAFPGSRRLPEFPQGLTLAELDLEVRTLNALAAAGLLERPQDLRCLTLDDLLGLRGFWVKSLVDLVTSLEYVAAHPESQKKPCLQPEASAQKLRAHHGYPRLGHCLAPQLLKELLLERLPADLVHGTPYEGRRLCDLDEQVWQHLTLPAIARLAGQIVVRAELAGYHRAVLPRNLPELPRGMRLEDLQLEESTYQCLAGEGLGKPPERLAKLTVGDLLLLDGFDARCLVDLLASLETLAGKQAILDVALTAEAKSLGDLPEAAVIRFHDPRLGTMLRAMDTEANTIREMAASIVARRVDPPESRHLCQQLRQLRQKIEQMKTMPLDEELSQIFDPGTRGRDQEIMAGYFGWDGQGGRAAEAVGKKYGLSRERVRQICGVAIRRVRNLSVFAPALDRTLALVGRRPPMPLAKLQEEFDRSGLTSQPFPLESLPDVATFLSRECPMTILEIGRLRMAARAADAGTLKAVFAAFRQVVKKSGLGSVDHVMAELKRRGVVVGGRDFVRETIQGLDDFAWLDKRRNWFHVGFSEHFGPSNLIEKILSVAGHINATLMRAAMARSRRHQRELPPPAVLLEYCRQMPGVRVRGSTISADPPRDWRKLLAGIERTMVQVLKKHGSIMPRSDFEEQCLRKGMNRFSFNAVVTNSPVVLPFGRCLYGLVGTPTNRRAMARVLNHRPVRRTERVLAAHGLMPDGRVYVAYHLSPAVVASGIVTVPAALKRTLCGKFSLRATDGSENGTLTVKNSCAWGLGPVLRARGARQGDFLLLLIDVARRQVHMHLGGESVLDLVKA